MLSLERAGRKETMSLIAAHIIGDLLPAICLQGEASLSVFLYGDHKRHSFLFNVV